MCESGLEQPLSSAIRMEDGQETNCESDRGVYIKELHFLLVGSDDRQAAYRLSEEGNYRALGNALCSASG